MSFRRHLVSEMIPHTVRVRELELVVTKVSGAVMGCVRVSSLSSPRVRPGESNTPTVIRSLDLTPVNK